MMHFKYQQQVPIPIIAVMDINHQPILNHQNQLDKRKYVWYMLIEYIEQKQRTLLQCSISGIISLCNMIN